MATAALLLAAGASTRFGSPKQLAIYEGTTLLERAIGHAQKAGCAPILVVTGKYAIEVEKMAQGLGAKTVHNPHWNHKQGMRLSVSYGLLAMLDYPDWQETFVLPTDLPWFTEVSYLDFKVAKSNFQEQYPNQVPTAQLAINYPEGPGIPALLTRQFIQKTDTLQLRKHLANSSHLLLLPPGHHTKDVDYPEDLL